LGRKTLTQSITE